MADLKPWEKYAAQAAPAAESGPWDKYAKLSQSQVDQIPSMSEAEQPLQLAAPAAATPNKDGILGRIGGALEVPLAMGTGIVGGVAGNLAGLYAGATSGKFGTQAGVKVAEDRAHEVASSLTYQPRTQTGNKLLQTVGDAINDSGIAGVPLPELNALGRAAVPAKNALMDVTNARLSQSGNALASVASKAMPTMSPNVANLAQKAEAYDIPLRPDMLSSNKLVRIMGDSLEKVPLSGSKAGERQIAYNKAVIRAVGGDEAATNLTPDVFSAAMEKSGGKIGEIASRTHVGVDAELSNAFKSHLENAAKFETSDVQKVITNYIEELQSKAEDGVIPGDAFRKINSKIGRQMGSSSNGDLKHALGSLQDDLQDALQRHASADDLPALLDARRQYAIGKTIEPLVAKSANGDISPAGLMGRVTANSSGKSRMATGNGGELGDLARIGQQFLKEPGSSNTAERGVAYGVLGGSIATHPLVAAGVYSAANLYNRLGPKVAGAIVRK